ncbi:MAG: coenzyme F420-0:L-glutamate ligase, partial [Nostocoides sp.]
MPPVDAIQIVPVRGLPEVAAGDDVAGLIQPACAAMGLTLFSGDIVVVSSKIISKAAGLWADTRTSAMEQSTVRVVAERATPEGVTQVVESVAGPVMAAGGVDASNTGGSDRLLLLPSDPDAAAAALLEGLLHLTGLPAGSLGVVVTDTAGRPWRTGQTDFALGSAGVLVLDDLRGAVDADGRPLAVTA